MLFGELTHTSLQYFISWAEQLHFQNIGLFLPIDNFSLASDIHDEKPAFLRSLRSPRY